MNEVKELIGKQFSLRSIIGGIHSRLALMRKQDLIEAENGYAEFMKRLFPQPTKSLSNSEMPHENIAAREQLAKSNRAALTIGRFLIMIGARDLPQGVIPEAKS